MVLTVYVTEDFGDQRKKDRFQRRRVIQHPNVHSMESTDLEWRLVERMCHHATNLPKVPPTFYQKIQHSIRMEWYHLRQGVSQWISPMERPPILGEKSTKVRQASVLERRKILEELWQELSDEKQANAPLKQVLRITESSTEVLVAE